MRKGSQAGTPSHNMMINGAKIPKMGFLQKMGFLKEGGQKPEEETSLQRWDNGIGFRGGFVEQQLTAIWEVADCASSTF